jgi:hypothetical protein
MLADRRSHSAGEGVNLAEARLTLGRALLAAGHPVEARGLVEEAHLFRRTRFVSTGFRLQDDMVCRARIALVLADPGRALALIEDSVAHTDWFAENVSFRLAYQARLLRSIALARLGDAESARHLLTDDFARLQRTVTSTWPDPLLLDYRHAIVETQMHLGDLSIAASELRVAIRREAGLEEDLPRRGRTLLLRARLAMAEGDDAGTRNARKGFDVLIGQGLDRTHPLVLTARYEEAECMAAAPEQHTALAPVLDRRPLEHGRPALGDGHPLLLAARDLATRTRLQQPGDEDLPWDLSEDHR